MADSNITKKALAQALKELMAERPFSKINVGNICERCEMNRKSFYYHFKDKYDLVNWIFDTEIITVIKDINTTDVWEILSATCKYLYENRTFYRKAFKIEGQNCFKDHFHNSISTLVELGLKELFESDEIDEFYINFIADGFICAIARWIVDKDCISHDEFVSRLRIVVNKMAAKVYSDNENSKSNKS